MKTGFLQFCRNISEYIKAKELLFYTTVDKSLTKNWYIFFLPVEQSQSNKELKMDFIFLRLPVYLIV